MDKSKIIGKIINIGFILFCVYGMLLPIFMLLMFLFEIPIYIYWDREYLAITWNAVTINLIAFIMLFIYFLKSKNA